MNTFLLIIIFIASYVSAHESAEGPPSLATPFIKKDSRDSKPMEIKIESETKVLTTDTNNDRKPDIFDEFGSDGGLKTRRRDLNFDGKIDQITEFPQKPNDPTIVKTDRDYDGYFEILEEIKVQDGILITIKKSDLSKKGLFEVIDKHYSVAENAVKETTPQDFKCDLTQDQASAELQQITEALTGRALIKNKTSAYFDTNFGFKIQRACIEKLGEKKVLDLLSDSIKQGISCQWQLGSPESRANVHKMVSLLMDQQNPPKLICDVKKLKDPDQKPLSSNTIAHATFPSDKAHPSIFLNMSKLKETPQEEAKGVVFHEATHLLGYYHGQTFEYSHTCESCCFHFEKKEMDNLDCKLCKGGYLDIKGEDYLTDLTKFYKASERTEANFGLLLDYLKDKPKDRWGRLELASSLVGGLETPMAIAFAEDFEKKFAPLSELEKTKIEEIKKHTNDPDMAVFLPIARSIAGATASVLDGDPKTAEQQILSYNPKKYKALKIEPNSEMNEAVYNFRVNLYQASMSDAAWKIYFYYRDHGDKDAAAKWFNSFLSKLPR